LNVDGRRRELRLRQGYPVLVETSRNPGVWL
jgi:hypothetical protein